MRRQPITAACLAGLALALPAGGLGAAPPPQPGWLSPGPYADWLGRQFAGVRPPEIVEMLTAVAAGGDMGPGQGWFHPGQSRYGWAWLTRRHGKDADGTITRQEFQGPAEMFERLDRDHDGVLTAADFDWSDRAPLARQAGLASQWFRLLDANSNGRISREEWQAFFDRAARGKKYLTPEDLQDAVTQAMPPPAAGKKPEGPSPLVLVAGLLSGELGSFHEGPAVGDVAPDFTLRTQDGKDRVRLSQYRGKKPVVLVFGSFT
jgi:hypothetical protein